jgi:hypothetical protein
VLRIDNQAPDLSYLRHDLNVFRRGAMSATLAWPNATKDLDLYLSKWIMRVGR